MHFIGTTIFNATKQDYVEQLTEVNNELSNVSVLPLKTGQFCCIKIKGIETIYIVQIQRILQYNNNNNGLKGVQNQNNLTEKIVKNAKKDNIRQTYKTSSGRIVKPRKYSISSLDFTKIVFPVGRPPQTPKENTIFSEQNLVVKQHGKKFSQLFAHQNLYFLKLLIRKEQLCVQPTKRKLEHVSQNEFLESHSHLIVPANIFIVWMLDSLSKYRNHSEKVTKLSTLTEKCNYIANNINKYILILTPYIFTKYYASYLAAKQRRIHYLHRIVPPLFNSSNGEINQLDNFDDYLKNDGRKSLKKSLKQFLLLDTIQLYTIIRKPYLAKITIPVSECPLTQLSIMNSIFMVGFCRNTFAMNGLLNHKHCKSNPFYVEHPTRFPGTKHNSNRTTSFSNIIEDFSNIYRMEPSKNETLNDPQREPIVNATSLAINKNNTTITNNDNKSSTSGDVGVKQSANSSVLINTSNNSHLQNIINRINQNIARSHQSNPTDPNTSINNNSTTHTTTNGNASDDYCILRSGENYSLRNDNNNNGVSDKSSSNRKRNSVEVSPNNTFEQSSPKNLDVTDLSEVILSRWDSEADFDSEYARFVNKNEACIAKVPVIGFVPINLYKMFKSVISLGGYKKVTREHKWKTVFFALNPKSEITNATTCTRRHYEKLLYNFEQYICTFYKQNQYTSPYRMSSLSKFFVGYNDFSNMNVPIENNLSHIYDAKNSFNMDTILGSNNNSSRGSSSTADHHFQQPSIYSNNIHHSQISGPLSNVMENMRWPSLMPAQMNNTINNNSYTNNNSMENKPWSNHPTQMNHNNNNMENSNLHSNENQGNSINSVNMMPFGNYNSALNPRYLNNPMPPLFNNDDNNNMMVNFSSAPFNYPNPDMIAYNPFLINNLNKTNYDRSNFPPFDGNKVDANAFDRNVFDLNKVGSQFPEKNNGSQFGSPVPVNPNYGEFSSPTMTPIPLYPSIFGSPIPTLPQQGHQRMNSAQVLQSSNSTHNLCQGNNSSTIRKNLSNASLDRNLETFTKHK